MQTPPHLLENGAHLPDGIAGKTGTYADNYQPSYSTAGFYSLSNTGRTIYSMNPAWLLS